MTNPTTIDRRDVAHKTNPLGDRGAIEQDDLARPPDPQAGGLPRGIPPARSGKSAARIDPAEVRNRTSGSGGADRIDPASRMPPPVTEDAGDADRSE